ncbi:MAG: SDR family oxidoreductase [Gammaproteobacteria bacterium]|jgi:3-oxoacyl-[acyl-carrier protein] reductase|nr:SDR family oxidoreductase [Gammaproteobacteria bacterium]
MSRRWVVTGGSRGVGLATAKLALQHGDRVAVLARNIDEAKLRAELGNDVLLITADVTQSDSVSTAFSQIDQQWGGIDVLINNAGLHRGGKLQRLATEDWEAVLKTNLSGPMMCIRNALPYLGAGSAIINVGAVVGLRGFPGDSAYGASKAGLSGLTQVLAIELAPKNIRVNLVIPGLVITEMTSQLDAKALDKLIERIPLGRVGQEDEIAQVIWWVAGSTYMTGAIIPTDGGMLAQL